VSQSNDELARLREQNAEQAAQIRELNRTIGNLTEQLSLTLKGNADLQEQLKDLRNKLDILLQQYKTQTRSKYGKKGEKHNPRPAPAESPDGLKPPKPPRPAPRNHKKHILDHDLPIEHVHHYIDDAQKICPTCLVETKKVRDQITFQLERVSHALKKLEHRQEVRSCPKCKQYVVTAEKPPAPIPGSYVGPRLLAHTIVSKLAYGLPLYRQAKWYDREKNPIPRSTQCDWMLAAARMLEQIYQLMKLDVKLSEIIKTDDTVIGIQDPGRDGTLRKGKMTPYVGDRNHPCIIFEFSPDQSFAKNRAFFENFRGIIQADAAGGWDALFKDGSRKCAGCHAHSRRKYYEYLANNSDDPDCYTILEFYRELYIIEDSIKDMSPAERLAVRRRRSKPVIKNLRQFLIGLQSKYPPSNKLMKAVAYTLRHWIPLTRFLKNGALDIDNNSCERIIKEFVLSRKNFLFVASDDGGEAAAILCSFIATCNRLGVDPAEYFTDVFSRINAMKPSDLATLVPTTWLNLRQQKKAS
jgi:transposase